MATLLRPDVYVNQVKSGAQSIPTTANLVGAMVGATRSGELNKPTLISSFAEFVEKFANGLDTPYSADSYLAYAVYGFYANGGGQLYITRIAHSDAAVAQYVKAQEESTTLTLKAKSVGTWGNALSLVIAKNEDWVATTNEVFDITGKLTFSGTVSDSFKLTAVTTDTFENALLSNVKFQSWFDVDEFDVASGYALAEKTFTLTGGTDGVSSLTDTDYSNGIDLLDALDDITLLACPGWTTTTTDAKMMTFGDSHQVHPIMDMPINTSVADAKAKAKARSGKGGAYYYPWIVVNDPLTDALKTVPTAGHVMGQYASTVEKRGLGKVPAGVENIVAGAVDVEKKLMGTDVDILNPVCVNCICVRANYGICIWGARSLNKNDAEMRYVSDVIINYVFTRALYAGTQFAVFEPNDEALWTSCRAAIKTYLRTQYDNGVLRGANYDEAFYVVCDKSNNTDATQLAGELHIEVGYASKKPAEFVVINLAHSMQS